MVLTVVFRYTGIALQFVIMLLLARELSPHDYGLYLFVLSAVLPTYFLLGLGASESFVREAPKRAVRGDAKGVAQLVGGTLRLAVGTAVAVVLACALLIPIFAHGEHGAGLLWFIAAFFVANGLMFNAAQILLGLGADRWGAFFFYPAVNISLLLGGAPYVLLSEKPTFLGVGLVTSAAASCAALVSLVVVVIRTRPQRASIAVAGHLVRSGLKLSGARLLYTAGLWLPTFVAGLVLSASQAGYLGTAGRLAVAVSAVGAAFRFAVRPSIVRAFETQDVSAIQRICARLATATFGLSCVALVANMLLGRALITLLFGSGFEPVAPLLSILLVGIAAEAFAGPVDEVLKMTGHEDRVLKYLGAGVATLAVALVLTARVGVEAMAAAQALYSVIVFGLMIVAVRRALGVWIYPTVPAPIRRRLRRSRSSIEIG